ncbi:MAG TPA: TetR/AcrR family transcriptional regulator, partial [Actinopolymorphaceae bacterium]
MTDQPATPRRGRGRRPAAEVRGAVLAAAGRLLLEKGLSAVTFDRVAREAGSSKVTLYKWWPSPGALAAEAYFARSAPVLAFPDTGDIRADLISQLTSFVRWLTREGAATPVAQLIGAAQSDPDVARAWA